MMKGLLIVIIVSLIAVRWLFAPGFLPTHDGEYHLIRFYEFGKMLAAGNLFPRWAPGLNSGYGVPLFTFFYPLPNYIGSVFQFLGWSLADSFRLTMAVGYGIAVAASYIWMKRLFGVFPAVLGSIIGAFTPYWFVDIFVRGSVGEILALGFVFTSLACIVHKKRTLLTFSIAAIILSHNIMAMIFLPILVIYMWIIDRSLLRSMILGIIMTSYFWVPALLERGYVTGLNTVNFKDHFPDIGQLLMPSWGTGFSGPGFTYNEMSYQVGIVPILVVIAVLMTRAWGWEDKSRKLSLLFMGAVGMSFFLMLEISVPVWDLAPILTNLQYPWRLLSVIIVATPFFSAAIFSNPRKRVISLALAGLAVMISFSYTKPVLYAPRPDEYYLSRRDFTDGTSSLGNGFSTRWMAWKSDRPENRMEIISGDGHIIMKKNGAMVYEGDIVSTSAVTVRVNVSYYPGWQVVVDKNGIPAKPDSYGTISVDIPKGTHRLNIHFSETPLRLAVDMISIFCLFWLFYSTILTKRYAHSH